MSILSSCSPSIAQTSAATVGAPWRQYASAHAAGFDSARLEVARRYADSVKSGAVMIVHDGIVVAAWGDVSRKLELHSVRKSLVSALFGIAAARGEVDLDRTLGDIGITDREPLTASEQGARIRDLLAARSGVYLPAAYADASQDTERPSRGSHAPNTFWFYNNWDFNTLGVIYERLVDSSLYRSFDERIARPIGMEDYTPDDGFLVYEPTSSIHPAHTIRMSARDLARFGELYLRGGRWGRQQVVPTNWVAESTTPKSVVSPDRGYADLWWTQTPSVGAESLREVNRRALFYGSGTGGQLVAVIPSDDLVIVHRGDTDHGRKIAGRDAWHIVELILEARDEARVETRTGVAESTPGTVPLGLQPFVSQLPAVLPVTYVTLDNTLMSELAGEYVVSPGRIVSVFTVDRRLFGNFPGLGEAQLFALTRAEFTIRVEPGVSIVFERDEQGRVKAFDARIGGHQLRAVRR